MWRIFALLGAVANLLAVLSGAFGAHALRGRLEAGAMQIYQTAVQYHFYHGLGLLAVAFVMSRLTDSPLTVWAGSMMCVGLLLFSGSLYALALSGVRAFGAVTPLGGVAFVAGWALLALALWRAE